MKDNKEQILRIVIRNICKITITKCQKNVHINIFMLLLLLIIFYYFTNSTSLSDELEDFKFRNFKILIVFNKLGACCKSNVGKVLFKTLFYR